MEHIAHSVSSCLLLLGTPARTALPLRAFSLPVTIFRMKIRALALLGALLLAACASPERSAQQAGDAVTAPLGDLNLVRAEIPPVLAAAQKGPYAAPEDWSCPALAAEIAELDAALGADLDTPVTAANPSLIERGAELATDSAIGQLRGATTAVVPFRGWVRKLSGAERYSREVSASIAAGTIRRAYLKGLGRAENCQEPAAPR